MTVQDKSTKAWYVSCSPRSPEKIAPELRLLLSVQGKLWSGVYTKELHEKRGLPDRQYEEERKKFEVEKRKNQDFVAKQLAELPDFKGDTFEKEISFSIRDRVAPMKTYGFVYVDNDNKLQITPAGKMIIDNRRPKEVFLKQMLKWQYPSYQHGTARPHPSKYPTSEFNIFPYVSTLNIIYSLHGLTKIEMAIFCLTLRHIKDLPQVKKEIVEFRDSLSKITGKNPRIEFVDDYHYKRFYKIYEVEALSGKTIREGKTENGVEEYIKTKIRNSYDIADAAFRYFRYTGLLSSKRNRVIILEERENDVKEVLSREYNIYPYEDSNRFYSYFGDPTLPRLQYEDTTNLIGRIKGANEESIYLLAQIKKINPNTIRQTIKVDKLETTGIEDLKDLYYAILENKILLKRDLLVGELQDNKAIEGIIIPELAIFTKTSSEINDLVSERFITDKNSVFEYVVWRAFIAFGDAIEYKNNFLIDEDLNILNHAPGNQGDMEISYRDFVLLVEVTTSSGITQFRMEGEPVTRHYEELAESLKTPLYCLFIANVVNENTYKEFYRYNQLRKTKIIPLTLKHFISIINSQKELLKSGKAWKSTDLKNYMDILLEKLNGCTRPKDWVTSLLEEEKKFVN